jgi:hypothetical protein
MSGLGQHPYEQGHAFQDGIFTTQPERYGFQFDALQSYRDGSLGALAARGPKQPRPPGYKLPPRRGARPGMTFRANRPFMRMSGVGDLPEPLASIVRFAPIAGAAMGVYHGYNRNKGSVPWALGWGAFGYLLWFVAMPLAFVQGVGQPAGK